MSVRVMSWVFEHSRSMGSDRLVLLVIADHANDSGCEAWPSLDTIAKKAGLDRRTVSRSVGRLIDLGELSKVRNGGLAARGGVSNSYRITMPDYAKQGQPAPRGDTPPLGASGPEVGAAATSSGGEVSTNPSLTTHNHPRPAAETADPSTVAASIADGRRALKRDTDEPNPATGDDVTPDLSGTRTEAQA